MSSISNECFRRRTSIFIVVVCHQRRCELIFIELLLHCIILLVALKDIYHKMAKGTNKQFSTIRQIPQTRLYDDGNLETRYEILNKLGEGSFGTVSRVKNKENDLFYAMKTIPKKVILFLKNIYLKKFEFFLFSLEINPKHQVLIMKLNY